MPGVTIICPGHIDSDVVVVLPPCIVKLTLLLLFCNGNADVLVPPVLDDVVVALKLWSGVVCHWQQCFQIKINRISF